MKHVALIFIHPSKTGAHQMFSNLSYCQNFVYGGFVLRCCKRNCDLICTRKFWVAAIRTAMKHLRLRLHFNLFQIVAKVFSPFMIHCETSEGNIEEPRAELRKGSKPIKTNEARSGARSHFFLTQSVHSFLFLGIKFSFNKSWLKLDFMLHQHFPISLKHGYSNLFIYYFSYIS